tara:strand:- start:461 stop:889 length:429 start_codon:yes stop_codon:yes gene_type:complete
MNIPDHILSVLREYDMPKDSVYQHAQSKQYLVKHKALEQIANNKQIVFDPPQILHLDAAKKECVMLITGKNQKEQHWSIGESSPYNTKINFPCSMAEARGKDRVILKFLNFKDDIKSESENEVTENSKQEVDTESLTYTPGN